ncbi:Ig-like domain-containing protein, partial [Jiulongibacter sediminis]
MQKLYPLIPLLLCNFNLLAQSPSFTGQPSLVDGFVCYGSDAQISASINSADVYQLQIQDGDSGTWSDYGGITGDATSGSILIVLPNYTLSNHFRIRITNNTSGDSNFSDVFFIDAQRPQLTIQPQNQVRCYGERVYFYVDNNATWTYTWERSNDGGAFGSFSGSKYQDQTTSSFNINTVNGADDNDAFRVKVTDPNGCETISNAGLLSINNIGTIQPTTSTTFCEGEEATFSTSVTGTLDSYSWNFYDESSGVLTVSPFSVTAEQITLSKAPQGLDEAELEVDFVSQVMNTDGSTSASTCNYARSRTGYTTYDRPDLLAALGDSICGPGDVTLVALDEICGTYEWYTDTASSPVASGPFEYDFTDIGLSATTNYYVRQIDCVTGCPSDFAMVEAKVNPLPSVVLSTIEAVCPDAISFSIPLTSFADADSFQVILTSGTLTGYTDASGYIRGNSIDVPLPAGKSSGNYGFDLKIFNTFTGCESTVSLSLRVKEPTAINSALSPQTLCEGDILTFNADASGEGTLSYQWFFEDSEISGATGSSYSIPSVLTTSAGNYHYAATGECGTATAIAAAIVVNPQTKINEQPQSQEVCLGADATFTLSATGFGTLSYQWKKDGADVGTDSPTLILSGVLATDNGAEITCVVTGGCDDSTSAIAILTVLSLPSSPVVADTGFCQNSTSGPLEAEGLHTLNWYGMNATGGTASATAPTPSTTTIGVFSYYVSQTDTKGCESARAKLDVTIDPALTTILSSSNRDVCAYGNLNKTVLFTVRAFGGKGSYTYQWGKNGSDLVGENSIEYTGTGSGNYFVNVTSGYCELNKDLTINTIANDLTPTPTATANGQAIPYAFCSGSAVALEATDESGVTGTTLNWYANNSTTVVLQSGNPFESTSLTKDTVFYVSASATYGLMTCESDRTPVNLVLSPQPSATADVVNETCVGAADGSVTLTPGTSFLPYSFQLDSGSPQATNVLDELASGTYTITLQDANGCTATQSVIIGQKPPLSFDYGPEGQTNCKGNVVYFESQPSTDAPQQWYKKLPGGSWEAIDGETENRLRVGSIGNSSNPASTFYRMVIGTGLCAVSSDSAELFVNEFTANLDNQTACEGDDVTFEPPASTGNIIEYEWQKRIGTSGSWNPVQTGSSPNFEIASASAVDDDAYYRVKLTFFNPNETTCTETSDQGKLDLTVIDETTLSGSAEICEGETTTLTASGCNGTVEWSDTQTGESIDVSPASTTIYTANCTLGGCSEAAVNSVTVTVKSGIAAPFISASTTELCFGQTAELSLSGCSGDILWSTNETTATIVVNPISSVKYSAKCTFDGCTSPPADSVEIFGSPVLVAGAIDESTAVNCAGYNPPTIQNATAHSGGKGVLTIQWEMSEDCSARPVVWSEIAGANGETFNPSTLYQTTCYRRKVTDECDTEVYSNIVTIEIVDDPSVTVTADADTICSLEPFILTAHVTGGTGTCYTSWQRNLSSSAAGSSFWEDISGDTFTQAIS